MNTSDYAQILNSFHPEVSFELALRVAQAGGNSTFAGASVPEAVQFSRGILRSFGVRENLVDAVVGLAIEIATSDPDLGTLEKDAAIFMAEVFQAYSEVDSFTLGYWLCRSKINTIWDIVCALPGKIWINLEQDSHKSG